MRLTPINQGARRPNRRATGAGCPRDQHLSEVERQWFRRVLAAGEPPTIHPGGRTSEGHDGGFEVDPAVSCVTVVEQWQAEVDAARATCAARSLDGTAAFMGAEVGLRWIYRHMISEYARHCGHADILRERIDGATGA